MFCVMSSVGTATLSPRSCNPAVRLRSAGLGVGRDILAGTGGNITRLSSRGPFGSGDLDVEQHGVIMCFHSKRSTST